MTASLLKAGFPIIARFPERRAQHRLSRTGAAEKRQGQKLASDGPSPEIGRQGDPGPVPGSAESGRCWCRLWGESGRSVLTATLEDIEQSRRDASRDDVAETLAFCDQPPSAPAFEKPEKRHSAKDRELRQHHTNPYADDDGI